MMTRGQRIHVYDDQRQDYIEGMAVHAHGLVVRRLREAVALCAPLVSMPAAIDAKLACFTRAPRDTETYAQRLQ